MGSLISKIPEIDGAYFWPTPRKISPKTVACVDGQVFIEGNNGSLYTNGELKRRIALHRTSSDHPAVQALVIFGRVTSEQAWAHGKAERLRRAARDMFFAVEDDFCRLKDAGIELTPAQKSKLTRMKKALKLEHLPCWLKERAAAWAANTGKEI